MADKDNENNSVDGVNVVVKPGGISPKAPVKTKAQVIVGGGKTKGGLLGLNLSKLFRKKADNNSFSGTKRARKLLKVGLLIAAVVAFVAGGTFGFYKYNEQKTHRKESELYSELDEANKFVIENNIPQALIYAKKALDKDPNNVDSILTVANLTLKENPDDAKQYFLRVLEIYKKENNIDAGGKTAISYWATATLAEDAGETEQAKKYYKSVIDAADPADMYHQSLVRQSKAALERLK